MSSNDKTGAWRIKIAVCLLAVAPFLLTPWVHGDGVGSVAFLRSLVVDRDLDLAEEFDYLSTHIVADAGGLPGALLERSEHTPGLDPLAHTGTPDPVTGRVPFFASVGPPLIWSPAYVFAHSIVRAGNAVGLDRRADGYGGLYYLAIALTTLACGVLGLVLLFAFAREIAPPREAFFAALCVAFASPLLYYLYLAPTYPHSITMLTTGAFFLYWWRRKGSASPGVWFRWGLLTGFLFIVRWNDAAVVVPALALEITRYLRGDSAGARPKLSGALVLLGAALVGFALVASVQLALWQYFHGRTLIRYPLSALGFRYEGLWGTFVSAKHGLFIWHPITILATLGVFLLFRRNRELAGVLVATLALSVASNCTIHDWWGGASFGMRRLLSATPAFMVGLAVFLDEIRRLLWRRGAREIIARLAAPAITVLFSAWNVLLLLQYALGMISHTGAVGFATIAANQSEVIGRFIRLIGDALK